MGCSSSKEASLEESASALSAAKNTATITKEEGSTTLPGPDPDQVTTQQVNATLPGPNTEQDEACVAALVRNLLACVAANPVAQANTGTTTSVQNRLTLGKEFANCASF
eukprot:CAMPEP_0206371958 /NCGR_PEP_ID=MMETSP0294-20121207/6808_1 /ASSEMBLY_ACC=CAM_ASM_000327 /TAXON_ID=39354 /ORGANISM="Heterosigma akashiwo, Strain CCMP2393" /LENGTH=108 /DNA_ID=CAMNT_0053819215 /DNA_START=318 /DNA_END=641 /DNA_ORIENTATION=-